MERIIVMGGSFNPPTLAHLRLMEAAMRQLDGSLGVFVPSSDAYVARKQSRLRHGDHTALPAEVRVRLLEMLCEGRPKLTVDTRELRENKTWSHTIRTLRGIQAEHPGAQVLFIFGGDKLRGLSRWSSFEELTSEFQTILFGRDQLDLEAIIKADPALSARREAFILLPQPEGAEGISATEARERLNRGDSLDGFLPPAAQAVLREWTPEPGPAITSFHDSYFFLSNFYPCPVTWEGLTYQNSEAAFQAAKCLEQEERLPFCSLQAGQAKRLGRKVSLRPDWEQVKDRVMLEVVRCKFRQHPDLAARLLATSDTTLMEGNNWHDTYWGVDSETLAGGNHLGQILMQVRQELRQGDGTEENLDA